MQGHVTKTCKVCRVTKPIEDFYLGNHENGRRYRHSYCKTCVASERKKWHNTPKGQKAHHRHMLRVQYGITVERYEQMLQEQNGLCAICGQAETRLNRRGEIRRLTVDHCHSTGSVRGLLCSSCNNGLGYFKDDPVLIHKALLYLRNYEGSVVPVARTK